jgi:hypothetical protein
VPTPPPEKNKRKSPKLAVLPEIEEENPAEAFQNKAEIERTFYQQEFEPADLRSNLHNNQGFVEPTETATTDGFQTYKDDNDDEF